MVKVTIAALLLSGTVSMLYSCTKKESGVCYCSYYSGDRTHYDLRNLNGQQQIDSCNRLNELASNFAGSCKLKK
ncbi:hypothetical protein [Edaphocola flava]|uniref:hypothetical protein n=1 Tax=Edaphocola flava TaxID=2499629 RepID=UPI00100B51B3|nr:hypothetical protein [Edaphocola flava]